MKKIHQYLDEKYSWYRNWHQNKHHNKAHWVIMVIVMIAFVGFIYSVKQGAFNSLGASVQHIANQDILRIGTGPVTSAVSNSGAYLYAVGQIARTVSVIDTNTKQVVATIPVSGKPRSPVVINDRLYVLDTEANSTISVIDTASNTRIATIPVGGATSSSSLTAVGGRLYVTNTATNTVSIFDTATNTITGMVAVGTTPVSATYAGGNYLYVQNNNSSNVSVINIQNNTVTATIAVGARPFLSKLIGSKIYVLSAGPITNGVAAPSLSVINTQTNAVTSTIPLTGSPRFALVVGSDLYVSNETLNTISIINSTTDTITKTIPVGTRPMYMTLRGTKVYVSLYGAGGVSLIDTVTKTVGAYVKMKGPIIGEFINGQQNYLGTAMPASSIMAGQNVYVFSDQGYAMVMHDDLTPPASITISAPTANTVVSGTVPFSVVTADDTEIATVKFYKKTSGGAWSLIGTDTTSPFSINWNTTTDLNNIYTIRADAFDASNNSIESDVRYIGVVNDGVANGGRMTNQNGQQTGLPGLPPLGVITSPVSGATLSGATNPISVKAIDDYDFMQTVTFYDNGQAIGNPDWTSPYSINWDVRTKTNGIHELTAKVTDAYGLSSITPPVTVTVNNPPTQPPQTYTFNITSPTSGATISVGSNQSLTATTDIPGVTRVVFLYDTNRYIGEDSTAPYSVNWNTAYVTTGNKTIIARAYNGPSIVATATVAVTITANPQTPPIPPTGDTTPPTAVITYPTGGTIAGDVGISADATDNVGVSKVEFYIDGILKAVDTAASWVWNWQTSASANGSHTITVKSYDAAGNSKTSAPVTVTVNNGNTPPPPTADTIPPTVSMTAPANGSTVSGTVVVSATAADNTSISRVEFYRNGTLISTSTSTPYLTNWNTATSGNGSYTWTARAYDAAWNGTTSAPISVTVNNNTVPQGSAVVTLTAPANGSTVSGTTTLSASVSGVTVTKVEFYRGSTKIGTSTTSPYSISWDSTTVPNGNHGLSARAYYYGGYKNSSTRSVNVAN